MKLYNDAEPSAQHSGTAQLDCADRITNWLLSATASGLQDIRRSPGHDADGNEVDPPGTSVEVWAATPGHLPCIAGALCLCDVCGAAAL